MRWVLCMFLLAGCGDSDPECQGPVGTFYAKPRLSINNCLIVPELKQMHIDIGPEDHLRACGWHDVYENSQVNPVNGCTYYTSRHIHTKMDLYRGTIIIEVRCPYGKCGNFWELEFVAKELGHEKSPR